MRLSLVILLLLSFLALSQSVTAQSTRNNVITVKMVDKSSGEWRFEPENIEVRPGDIVRFVQEDVMPHNVEFKESPEGAELGDLLFGRFVITKGDTYEFTIDERFVAGRYEYICTPHVTLGMKGSLTVAREDPRATN